MKIIAGLFLVLLAGCGSDVGTPSGGAVTAPTLEGKRYSPCHKLNNENRIEELRVAGGNFEVYTTFFQRDNCGIPGFSTRVASHVDTNRATNAARNIFLLDLSVTLVELVVHDEATVINYNQRSFCGYSDWERMKYKDVSGRDCSGLTLPKVGDRRFTVYQLRSDDGLYLGKASGEADGKTEAKRPREFDEARLFTRLAP